MEIIRNIARGRLRITVTIGAIAIGILALIEAYKIWLATESRSRAGGRPLNRVSIKNALINLHCFFDRITEWDYPNRPQRPLVFGSPTPPHPGVPLHAVSRFVLPRARKACA